MISPTAHNVRQPWHTRFRRVAAMAVAAAVALGLAACSIGPSVRDAERYAAKLAAVPGITGTEVLSYKPQGIPAPLVGSVRVTVPPEKKIIDAVVERACDVPNRKRTELVITITDGNATLHRVDSGCPSNTIDLAAVFEDMREANPTGYVWLGESHTSDDILVSDYETAPYDDDPDYETATSWMTTVAAVYRNAGATSIRMDVRDVVISSAPATEHLATIEALTSLSADYQLEQLWLTPDSLVVKSPSESAAAVLTTAVDEERAFEDHDTEVTALPLWSFGGTVTAPMIRVADAAAELGATEMSVDRRSNLRVLAPSVEAVSAWSERLAAANSEGVRVELTTVDGYRSFEVLINDPALVITAEQNPYPMWVDWYQRIAEVSPKSREIRGTIRFSTDQIVVFRPDETEVASITAVVEQIAEEDGHITYQVGGPLETRY